MSTSTRRDWALWHLKAAVAAGHPAVLGTTTHQLSPGSDRGFLMPERKGKEDEQADTWGRLVPGARGPSRTGGVET